ncbi:MAG TPA: hypothetical protein VG941_02235 [Candidatus Paceibacterota bacterium]|nr:hypothetical protein [Candidatus Paceibacterota bacterium]
MTNMVKYVSQARGVRRIFTSALLGLFLSAVPALGYEVTGDASRSSSFVPEIDLKNIFSEINFIHSLTPRVKKVYTGGALPSAADLAKLSSVSLDEIHSSQFGFVGLVLGVLKGVVGAMSEVFRGATGVIGGRS